MKRLFGTDGIRGTAGTYPLDPPTVRRFGVALGSAMRDAGRRGDVLLARDTRESGPWIRDAVAAGLAAVGVAARDAGVLSTPGLAWVVQRGDHDAGVMISASHNPFRDNGLKVFGPDGFKLSDALEAAIEARILDRVSDDPGESAASVADAPECARAYLDWLGGFLPADRLAGLRVVLDCANGAASAFAADAFRGWGATVTTLGVDPDGRNINEGCGSLHLERLGEAVAASGADLGLAFDGDADRCLAVDARGRTIDGDAILYVLARSLARKERLNGNAVVATIMSNYWLESALRDEGIALHRTAVGDKYVLERMLADGLSLGGEQSGHVIASEWATTGDGVLTAAMLVDALLDEGRSAAEIVDGIRPYPQRLINVPVREKPDLRAHPTIGPAVAAAEAALEGMGRVVLRYSGTEPLARVMVEAREPALVDEHVTALARRIEDELGA